MNIDTVIRIIAEGGFDSSDILRELKKFEWDREICLAAIDSQLINCDTVIKMVKKHQTDVEIIGAGWSYLNFVEGESYHYRLMRALAGATDTVHHHEMERAA